MNETITGVQAGVNVVNQSLVVMDNIIEKIERYKKLQSDRSAYLRLIYLEVINNL